MIVHDHLVQRGGAERVVHAMSPAIGAPVMTSLFDAELTYPELSELDIRASFLNVFGWLRKNHRWSFPFMALSFALRKSNAETTLIGSIGWGHFIRSRGRSIIYWYAPARWLYQSDVYLGGGAKGMLVRSLSPLLRRWDQHAVKRADGHLAVSTAVAARLKTIYGIDATVLHPPLTFAGEPTQDSSTLVGPKPGYLLAVSRFISYKNLHVIVETMKLLPHLTLVIVGTGPEEQHLRSLAGDNVQFTGCVDDDELAQLYQDCLCLVSVAHEDFGLTPLEAALFGRPAVAWRKGGYLDTIVDGKTGILIDSPSTVDLAAGISKLEEKEWDRDKIRDHAIAFRTPAFTERLTAILESDQRIEARQVEPRLPELFRDSRFNQR